LSYGTAQANRKKRDSQLSKYGNDLPFPTHSLPQEALLSVNAAGRVVASGPTGVDAWGAAEVTDPQRVLGSPPPPRRTLRSPSALVDPGAGNRVKGEVYKTKDGVCRWLGLRFGCEHGRQLGDLQWPKGSQAEFSRNDDGIILCRVAHEEEEKKEDEDEDEDRRRRRQGESNRRYSDGPPRWKEGAALAETINRCWTPDGELRPRAKVSLDRNDLPFPTHSLPQEALLCLRVLRTQGRSPPGDTAVARPPAISVDAAGRVVASGPTGVDAWGDDEVTGFNGLRWPGGSQAEFFRNDDGILLCRVAGEKEEEGEEEEEEEEKEEEEEEEEVAEKLRLEDAWDASPLKFAAWPFSPMEDDEISAWWNSESRRQGGEAAAEAAWCTVIQRDEATPAQTRRWEARRRKWGEHVSHPCAAMPLAEQKRKAEQIAKKLSKSMEYWSYGRAYVSNTELTSLELLQHTGPFGAIGAFEIVPADWEKQPESRKLVLRERAGPIPPTHRRAVPSRGPPPRAFFEEWVREFTAYDAAHQQADRLRDDAVRDAFAALAESKGWVVWPRQDGHWPDNHPSEGHPSLARVYEEHQEQLRLARASSPALKAKAALNALKLTVGDRVASLIRKDGVEPYEVGTVTGVAARSNALVIVKFEGKGEVELRGSQIHAPPPPSDQDIAAREKAVTVARQAAEERGGLMDADTKEVNALKVEVSRYLYQKNTAKEEEDFDAAKAAQTQLRRMEAALKAREAADGLAASRVAREKAEELGRKAQQLEKERIGKEQRAAAKGGDNLLLIDMFKAADTLGVRARGSNRRSFTLPLTLAPCSPAHAQALAMQLFAPLLVSPSAGPALGHGGNGVAPLRGAHVCDGYAQGRGRGRGDLHVRAQGRAARKGAGGAGGGGDCPRYRGRPRVLARHRVAGVDRGVPTSAVPSCWIASLEA
jgi:hypothetical protein